MNAWDHLPNASHIDRVLTHAKAHPEGWTTAWEASLEAGRDASWGAAREAVWNATRKAGRGAAWSAVREAVGDAAWPARFACYALIAWDDCGHLLDYTSDQLRAVLVIDPTYHAARLLLPAVIAMNGGDA